jgi:hypothetical protein
MGWGLDSVDGMWHSTSNATLKFQYPLVYIMVNYRFHSNIMSNVKIYKCECYAIS